MKDKTKTIPDMSSKELRDLYVLRTKELSNVKKGSGDHNFLIYQLTSIENEMNKRGKDIEEKFVKVSEKARELGVNPRTIKNWIIRGKVEGKIIENAYRKTWLVDNNIELKKIKGKHVKRERNSRGHFIKNG